MFWVETVELLSAKAFPSGNIARSAARSAILRKRERSAITMQFLGATSGMIEKDPE